MEKEALKRLQEWAGSNANFPENLDACIRDLVGKMWELGYQWIARKDIGMNYFNVRFNGCRDEFASKSPTLSLAICLAVGKYLDSVSKNSLPQSASGV